MFYLCNLKELDLTKAEKDGLSTHRNLIRPFLFFLVANRLPSEGADFIITQCGPDLMMYVSEQKQNMSRILNQASLHQHNFYELLFVVEGEMYQNIENVRHYYPAGSACILNPNVRHTEEYSTEFRAVYIQFSPTFLDECLDSLRYFSTESTPLWDDIRMLFYGEAARMRSDYKEYVDLIPKESKGIKKRTHDLLDILIHETIEPSPAASFRIRAGMVDLFYHVFNHENYDRMPVHLGSGKEAQLFYRIMDYIKEHHGLINRHDLTEHFHYSGNYIYRTVRKYTNLSIFEYAMKFRLQEAERLLTSTELTVSEICLLLEFNNRTHFYKLFKESYGMTPKQFRMNISSPARQ